MRNRSQPPPTFLIGTLAKKMRFTIISFLGCALMVATVIADDCSKGLYYCGSTLITTGMSMKYQRSLRVISLIIYIVSGDYDGQINTALIAANKTQDHNHLDNSVFFCNVDNTNSNITYVEFCENGCHNAGSGGSDYCL